MQTRFIEPCDISVREYELSMAEDETNQFIYNCPYRFSSGKHEGGCGHGDAPKGRDKKNGCNDNWDEAACPRVPNQ